VKRLMRHEEVKAVLTANYFPILFTGISLIEPFLFQSDVIDRNVFIASIFLTFLGNLSLFSSSLSFVVDHIKNVRRARALLIFITSSLCLLIAILLFTRVSSLTFVLILACLLGSYLAGTYETTFTYLIYKGKLDEQEYITLNQLNNGRMILSIVFISILSYLTSLYGKVILSGFFMLGGLYYALAHYFTLNFSVGERIKESGLNVTREALSKFVKLLRCNRKFFYVVFVGVTVLLLAGEQPMYFYGLFANSPDLYQLYSVYHLIIVFPYIAAILTSRRVVAKINKVHKFFLLSLFSLSLYVTILLISLFRLPTFLFFLGLALTGYALLILTYYIGITDYSTVPPEIEGYTTSILSLREYLMRFFTAILVAGYVIEYFGISASVSIVIGTSAPLMLFFYFRTRRMNE
jgi:hypothetical protein